GLDLGSLPERAHHCPRRDDAEQAGRDRDRHASRYAADVLQDCETAARGLRSSASRLAAEPVDRPTDARRQGGRRLLPALPPQCPADALIVRQGLAARSARGKVALDAMPLVRGKLAVPKGAEEIAGPFTVHCCHPAPTFASTATAAPPAPATAAT